VSLIPRFLDAKVPQRTKVTLQPRKSIVYIKFRKFRQNTPIIEIGVYVSATHGDQDGKGDTVIAMGDVVPKVKLR